MWGAPLPLHDGDGIHVSTFRPGRGSRARGVVGHEVLPGLAAVTMLDGLPLTTPAATWAALDVDDLVAVGDYFARAWRRGYGRPDAGKAPLATMGELRRALGAGRRFGARRLREAAEGIRADSWSPAESKARCNLRSFPTRSSRYRRMNRPNGGR